MYLETKTREFSDFLAINQQSLTQADKSQAVFPSQQVAAQDMGSSADHCLQLIIVFKISHIFIVV